MKLSLIIFEKGFTQEISKDRGSRLLLMGSRYRLTLHNQISKTFVVSSKLTFTVQDNARKNDGNWKEVGQGWVSSAVLEELRKTFKENLTLLAKKK